MTGQLKTAQEFAKRNFALITSKPPRNWTPSRSQKARRSKAKCWPSKKTPATIITSSSRTASARRFLPVKNPSTVQAMKSAPSAQKTDLR